MVLKKLIHHTCVVAVFFVLIVQTVFAQSSQPTVVYRINTGGPAITNSIGSFQGDQYYNEASSEFNNPAEIAETADDALYQSERWGSGILSYELPVANGQYEIILHFAELAFTSPNERVFDVLLEGEKVLDNFDIFAKVGPLTATTESFTVSVTDGILNIYLTSQAIEGGKNNPKISAVEVLSIPVNQGAPTLVTAIPDQQLISGEAFSYTFPASTFSNSTSESMSYAATLSNGAPLPSWLSFDGPTRTFSGTPPAGVPNSHVIKVTANINNGGSLSDYFIVNITIPNPNGVPVYQINSGGGAVVNAHGNFTVDEYFSSSSHTFSTTNSIAGTSNPAIYQSERWGDGTLTYNLPVSNGKYGILLHFAEIYHTTSGQRIFDVTIEGNKVLDNFDIVAKAGSFTATVEVFLTTVEDGTLTVHLSGLLADGGKDNPKISAIEVYKVPTSAGHLTVTNPIPDQSANIGNSFSFILPENTFSSTTSDPFSISTALPDDSPLPSWLIFNPSSRTLSGTPPLGSPSNLIIKVTASDNNQNSISDYFTLNIITPVVQDHAIYRINAGGLALANSIGVFSEDHGFSSESHTFSYTGEIQGTADDGIYQTERWGEGELNYNLPLNNGKYEVILHFAELYHTVAGERVFDIFIEDSLVSENYDIFAKAGVFTATTENYTATVSDGVLNINLSSLGAGGANNPKISAIEVLKPLLTPLQQDSLALVDLYNATGGENWTNNDNWLVGPLNTWYGVYLHNNRVYGLNLFNNNLNGELPESFGNLTDFWSVQLQKNKITRLPESVHKLIKLEYWDLSDNLLESLPNGFKALQYTETYNEFNVSRNPLDFGDLEDYFSEEGHSYFENFGYSLYDDNNTFAYKKVEFDKVNLRLSIDVGGIYNQYAWYKGFSLVQIGPSPILDISSEDVSSDISYRCLITNSRVRGLEFFGTISSNDYNPSPFLYSANYNGNISAIRWSSKPGTEKKIEKVYSYKYDNLNRLTDAFYGEWNSFNGDFQKNQGRYNEEGIQYDLNGNIKYLKRFESSQVTNKLMDDLEYKYVGNRLKSVDDGAPTYDNYDNGFVSRSTATEQYLYDENGNLQEDKNKGITISYNHLNLPEKVVFGNASDKNYILYIYDAAGVKLAKEVYESNQLKKTTHYNGNIVFEDDDLMFITHSEGRAIPSTKPGKSGEFEYEYFLKDHLGNTRLVVNDSEEPNKYEFLATMEKELEGTPQEPGEEQWFTNISTTRDGNDPLFNHTEDLGEDVTENESAKLNAADGKIIGPGIVLKVSPGDTVAMEVWAKYVGESETFKNRVTSIATSLVGAFAVGLPEAQKHLVSNALSGIPSVAFDPNNSAPRGYLNYIFFNKSYSFDINNEKDFGFQAITTEANGKFEKLELEKVIEEEGYLYIYVANESQADVNVFFDDLKVTHIESPVKSFTDYYPFGYTIAGLSGESAGMNKNRFKFNGRELQDDTFNNISLDLYDYKRRFFDPVLGRFISVDPLASNFSWWTPYQFTGNMPSRYVDLDGMEPAHYAPNGQIIPASDHLRYTPDPDVQYVNDFTGQTELDPLTATLLGITPAGVAIDAYDLYDAIQSGDSKDIAVAVVAFVPGGDLFKNGRKISNTLNNVSDATKSRVKLRKDTKEKIKENAPKTEDGKYIDPNTLEPIDGPVDIGHKPGEEWRTRKKMHQEKGSNRKEVIEAENNPDLYQIEDRKSNRSHKYEQR